MTKKTQAVWLSFVLLLAQPVAVWSQTAAHLVVESVWIHDVPGPPQGDFWDSAVANLFSLFANQAAIYPDVVVCATSASEQRRCAELCPDFKGDSKVGPDTRSEQCVRALRLPLAVNDSRMQLDLVELDPGRRRKIISVIVRNPGNCTSDEPCSTDTPHGPLVVSFSTTFRGVVGTVASPHTSSPSPSVTEQTSTAQPDDSTVWDTAKDWAGRAARQYAERKDLSKSDDAAESAKRAKEISQSQVNECLSPIAGRYGLESRMRLCEAKQGAEREDCIFKLVLSESPAALEEGRECKGPAQVQRDIDNIGKSRAYVMVCIWFDVDFCKLGRSNAPAADDHIQN